MSDVSLRVTEGEFVSFIGPSGCGKTTMLRVVADLQRSEALSLQKFLHLPVSPAGAFVVNYLTSLFSFTMLVFAPAMFGLSLGLAFSRGPTADETRLAAEFLACQAEGYEHDAHSDPGRLARVDLCQALMSMSEFIYVP